MSAIHERQWALEREREIRQAAHQQRMKQIAQETELFLRRYESVLNELVAEGLEQYMPTEFAHVRNEIHRIRNMDAWEGREVSRVLGNFIHVLPRQAREQRRIAEEYQRLLQEEAERAAKLQAEKLQAEKEQAWKNATGNWENKLARNLAFKELAALKQRIFTENFTEKDIWKAVAEIKQKAEQQAVETQQQFTKTLKIDAELAERSELIKHIETANLPKAQSERLKQQIEQASSEDLANLAQETAIAADQAFESEEVRKEMVKAVYKSLKEAGFIVLNPILQKEGDSNVVLVQASRPSGNQAKFRINLNGSVHYEFDNYRGKRCKEDMQKVLPKLSEIYGVNLSEERVIWENPDDELADAKPIAPLQQRQSK